MVDAPTLEKSTSTPEPVAGPSIISNSEPTPVSPATTPSVMPSETISQPIEPTAEAPKTPVGTILTSVEENPKPQLDQATQARVDSLNAERDLKVKSTLGNPTIEDGRDLGKIDTELASLTQQVSTPPVAPSAPAAVEQPINPAVQAPVIETAPTLTTQVQAGPDASPRKSIIRTLRDALGI